MKKGLKITGIIVGTLILALLILPFAFKGKIKELIVAEGNKMLNAQFEVGAVRISLIRNFPNATIGISDFNLWGVDNFQNDTLFTARKISATVNLKSLFSNSGYEIKRIMVSDASVRAIVLEDGRVNWDIMKPSEEAADTVQTPSDFRLKLRNFTLDNTRIVYDDRQGKMYSSLIVNQLICSGDMTAQQTVLKYESRIGELNFRYGGIPYLKNAQARLTGEVDAELDKMKFTFRDNSVSLNALTASLEGSFAMPEEGYDMDLRLKTEKIGFKELLSMIPAVYTNDFKSITAAGDVALAAWVKGLMTDGLLPAFEASLDVTNGSFRYPDLPQGVDRINIHASAANPGGDADRTVIDVNPLKFSMAGNPFAALLHLSTPVSDPAFALNAKGKLNLGTLKEVYPLEGTELNGILDADLDLKGRLSYVEKEQYDKFTASGTLRLSDMTLKISDMPDVRINQSVFTFTPQYLNLSETTVEIGKSDITADCRFDNYLAYALQKGGTIRGRVNMRSNHLDLNELMGYASSGTTESSPMSVFEVPKDVDLEIATSLKKVLYSNMDLENVAGQVIVRDGKLDMKNLSFNTLGGSAAVNGYYSTAASARNPDFNASFKLNRISFGESFKTFVTIQKLAPVFENLQGNYSGSLSLNTKLDSMMTPLFPTLNGEGALSTDNLNLSGVKVIDLIADATKHEELKNLGVKDMNVKFTIREGRVATKPFDLKMGGTTLNLSGSTGIDQTIDYTGKISLPASTGVIGKLTTLDLKIGGTFGSPKVSVDAAGMLQQAVATATEEVKNKVLDEVGKKLGVDIANAEKQREALIAQAQATGNKLVDEAKKQAENLMNQAGDNALKRLAAKKAGDKLVDEANKQSAALVSKATAEGDKLVEKAKEE